MAGPLSEFPAYVMQGKTEVNKKHTERRNPSDEEGIGIKKKNRGTHGDSLLILSEESGLSRKPPPQAKHLSVNDASAGGGSMSLK